MSIETAGANNIWPGCKFLVPTHTREDHPNWCMLTSDIRVLCGVGSVGFPDPKWSLWVRQSGFEVWKDLAYGRPVNECIRLINATEEETYKRWDGVSGVGDNGHSSSRRMIRRKTKRKQMNRVSLICYFFAYFANYCWKLEFCTIYNTVITFQ